MGQSKIIELEERIKKVENYISDQVIISDTTSTHVDDQIEDIFNTIKDAKNKINNLQTVCKKIMMYEGDMNNSLRKLSDSLKTVINSIKE